MDFSDNELDRFVDAAAALNALTIDAACRPGVRQFLQVAREMASTLDAADLDTDELALASVYTPPAKEEPQ
jgi:1-carboxybiuret hydrolase subunit AtzG-like